eukprot:gb/GECG01006790.1/.p1 GENE.gb/GECG01006790.1/~~gb/GECG01006790.1/.p1  ORF type:complete len:127 (+),score=13.36 gb/GECG01006790.1/:1-381(+)
MATPRMMRVLCSEEVRAYIHIMRIGTETEEGETRDRWYVQRVIDTGLQVDCRCWFELVSRLIPKKKAREHASEAKETDPVCPRPFAELNHKGIGFIIQEKDCYRSKEELFVPAKERCLLLGIFPKV